MRVNLHRYLSSLVLGLALCLPVQAEVLDRVLVVVNGEPLTLNDYRLRHALEANFNRALPPYNGSVSENLLEQLVVERLQLQEVNRLGLAANLEALAQLEAAFLNEHRLTPSTLPSALARAGLSVNQLRQVFLEQQQIQQLVRFTLNRHVQINDREIADYLARHGGEYADAEFNLAYLQIDAAAPDARNTLNRLRAQLQSNPDFQAAVAAITPLGGEGQVPGWRRAEQLPELFLDAVQDLPVPGVSNIIRREDRLYLLYLRDRRDASEALLTQYRVRQLLLRRPPNDTPEEFNLRVQALRTELSRGADFARLARLHSDDQASSLKGGELGWVGELDVLPALWRALTQLERGQISPPVQTPAGTHLLEVLDERDIPERQERLRSVARRILFERKAAGIYDAWLSNLRATALVEYINPSA